MLLLRLRISELYEAFYDLKVNFGWPSWPSKYLDHFKLKHPVINNAKQIYYRDLSLSDGIYNFDPILKKMFKITSHYSPISI